MPSSRSRRTTPPEPAAPKAADAEASSSKSSTRARRSPSRATAGAAKRPVDAKKSQASPAPGPSESAVDEATTPGMRIELYLLRHADAGDPMAWEGDDAERPLSGKGRRQARRVGRWLADLGRRPDSILTSPKARALQTATIVAASLGTKPKVDDRLAGPLDREVLEALVGRKRGETRRLMLVGHDPDFSSLASTLSGGPVTLRKGALARIDLADGEGLATGTLRWLVPADAVPER